MSDIQYPLEGSCQCGNIRYQLLAPPLKIMACHCKACQKLSTSAFSITALVNADSLVVQGELAQWERLAESGNKNYAKFCPHCGNRIYHFNQDQPETIKLKAASLDDTRILNPEAHIWVCQKQDWYQIPEGVPQFDKQP
ncbi:glutathione-dependent formaldehyde-activating protein [gamma proteobacterium BDW918]|uniref:CENP-V/GFA domain-containing protein n=1 Tax=Zhongshania aliphaticivorans TaxID=1470434 RepID=A0A127MAF3_9GAMM|nr:GFA family protein [Zhongshania aliphaticivorans]AMO70231.1 hypothetical protein AZF00_00320 [Zhongshania aliphaticivorans]EIF41504.1 glutathione-dependent formaldehyde-activating protein [gamma proteobacterium BDW918]